MKKIMKVLLGVLAVVLIVTFASSIVITQENEYTLIRRFGKIDRIEETAGISFKIPFIETTQTLPNQILLYDLASSDVITMDKKTMIADSFVLWQIDDPQKFAQTLNASITSAEGRIDATVYNAIKNVISNMTQNEIIASRDGLLQESIMEGIGESMEAYGLSLITVETKRLDLPTDNKQAVYERMISERSKIAASYQAEGDSEAQKIRNTTDKEIAITLSDAKAEAANIIAEGEAEYMKILAAAYSNDDKADFYSFVRSLDAAKVSLTGNNNTLILPKESPLAEVFIQPAK